MSKKTGLSEQAYEPVPEGGRFEPYISAAETPPEFTIKAFVPGILCGIAFGAANAYLGLQAGLTISTSIPIAVMTVAAFRAMRAVGRPGHILEANMSQTIGSASSSVASGVIFTLPALFLWGLDPSLMQMTLIGMFGGLLGVLFMIPLRRFLIEREHGKLLYPEGTACAEVLIASDVGGGRAKNVFLGLGAGAAFKLLTGLVKAFPGTVHGALPFIPRAELGMKMSPALFGVGYILGPKIAAVMVGGGLLSSLIIIPALYFWGRGFTEPFFPETSLTIAEMTADELWNRYVRYIGAGAVATAGLMTLIKSVPTMIESFRIGARQLRARIGDTVETVQRTAHDLPLSFVGVGVCIIALCMAIIPRVFGTLETFPMRLAAAVLVTIFAFFFVTVSSRIVGIVGQTSNPVSGMTIASLIGTSTVFLLMGWTDDAGKVAALCVGGVVAIAASISGDTSQDLKTGFLIGATPRWQQIGELIGVMTSAVFVCMTVMMLDKQPGGGFGSEELPAPQATLMKLVIEGILERKLPWALVGIGAGIAVLAEICRLPSLPFAVGVYLPVSTMTPVFLGGLLRLVLQKRARTEEAKAGRREQGILLGSGLVGGEGLVGVAVAGVAVYLGRAPADHSTWAGDFAPFVALVAFALLVGWFTRRCFDRNGHSAPGE